MKTIRIKTRPILPPQDSLYSIFESYLPPLEEGDILCITSKVLAIHQGRCIKISSKIQREDLVKREAEKWLKATHLPSYEFILTIKKYALIQSAGVDESNGNGYYILLPTRIQKILKEIHAYLLKKHKIRSLGLIATDSHVLPMRWGTVGISIGFYGFEPLQDYRGKKDIFGRKLKVTQKNIVDALAATAVFLMGEGSECVPLLILRGVAGIRFTRKDTYKKLVIPPKQDIYYPLLKSLKKPL